MAMICQKCRTPVKVDGSLADLNPASFKILADAAPTLESKSPEAPRSAAARERRQHYDDVSQHAGPPIHKRQNAAGPRTHDRLKPDMSYIMLTESQFSPDSRDEPPATPTKTKHLAVEDRSGSKASTKPINADDLEQTVRLFEILSARSDIDHPVCSECTELLLEELHKKQTSVTRERDAYVQFLKHAQEDVPTDEEKQKTTSELQDAQRREKQALEELEALEAEKAAMEKEIAALDAESEQLDEEEESFWRDRNALSAELTAYQEERDSLQHQLARDSKVLESLQRTNVYNDTFCISHDGYFGTINGLRLGRLHDHPVDWAEINAAWGQTMLLTSIIADKLRFRLQGWRLHPLGSGSRIEKVEASETKGTMFDLFSGGDVPLSFGLLHRSFDSGMVAFLDCLRQLGEHVQKTSTQTPCGGPLKMPYPIVKDKVGDASIKLGNFGQEEQWTKACKYTLTCCKFLLAHTSQMADQPETKRNR